MMMSWPEFLGHLIETSRKIDKAAVFDLSGRPLATVEDLEVTNKDGHAILRCMKDPARTLTIITLDDTQFRCFQGNSSALVGMGMNRKGRVLVARLTEEALVVVLGNSEGHGSFLFEVQRNLTERTRRSMAPPMDSSGGAVAGDGTQQFESSPRKIMPPPSSPVGEEQVLVQLHD